MRKWLIPQQIACRSARVVCATVDAPAPVVLSQILNGRIFEMIAETKDYMALYENVAEDRVAMAKCACVACNSCTCSCSCRNTPDMGEIEW